MKKTIKFTLFAAFRCHFNVFCRLLENTGTTGAIETEANGRKLGRESFLSERGECCAPTPDAFRRGGRSFIYLLFSGLQLRI